MIEFYHYAHNSYSLHIGKLHIYSEEGVVHIFWGVKLIWGKPE